MAEINFKALQDFFEADEIEWRLQQAGEKNGRVWAICVPYVTNRAIMQRLDDTVGPANWRNEFKPGPGGGVLCGIGVRVGEEWVTKWDGAENTDIEGVKGGLSGAMKRAAVQWGIGRYLYALEESFALVSENGNLRGKTKDGKSFKWDPPQLPAWALPKKAAPQQQSAAARSPADDDAAATTAYINRVWDRIPEDATVRVEGNAVLMKTFIKENAERIRNDGELRAALVQKVEKVTEIAFAADGKG